MDLNVLWFWIIGFFFIGYFVLDGFDFGVGIALPFIGKDNTDRRVLINTIGPIWDLNETWIIVGGACLFAAFPEWYASVFSAAYLALFLILIALILRGVSFEYRHQGKGPQWTNKFDAMIFIGSVVPALLWGVAVGNIVRGLPMDADFNFTGTFFDLLNPYSLVAGLTTLSLFFYHGLVFISLKTDGELKERAHKLAVPVGLVVAVLAIVLFTWTFIAYQSIPQLVFALVAVVAFVVSWIANLLRRDGISFTGGVVTIAFAVLSLFSSMFPNLLRNLSDPANPLTIYNGSATEQTLQIMSWAFLAIIPFVLGYQAWSFWTFRKRITRSHIESDAGHDSEPQPSPAVSA